MYLLKFNVHGSATSSVVQIEGSRTYLKERPETNPAQLLLQIRGLNERIPLPKPIVTPESSQSERTVHE